jgi:phage protein U
MFVLMGYGPFRFSIDSFGYEKLTRKFEANIEAQKIIGARPSLHRMGWAAETISLGATFHPNYLPGNTGLAQLAGLRASVGLSLPLLGNRIAVGDVFGLWALKSVQNEESEIWIDGVGQAITVAIELMHDGPRRPPSVASAIARLFG